MSISSAFTGVTKIVRTLQSLEPDFMHKNRISSAFNGVLGWISNAPQPLHEGDDLQDKFFEDYASSRKELGFSKADRMNDFEDGINCLALASSKSLNRLYENADNDIYSALKMRTIIGILDQVTHLKEMWDIAPVNTKERINHNGLKIVGTRLTPQNLDDAFLTRSPSKSLLFSIEMKTALLKGNKPKKPKI